MITVSAESVAARQTSPVAHDSLFNAFTEVAKCAGPRQQMDGTLRLTALFRRELQFQ